MERRGQVSFEMSVKAIATRQVLLLLAAWPSFPACFIPHPQLISFFASSPPPSLPWPICLLPQALPSPIFPSLYLSPFSHTHPDTLFLPRLFLSPPYLGCCCPSLSHNQVGPQLPAGRVRLSMRSDRQGRAEYELSLAGSGLGCLLYLNIGARVV